MSEPLAARYQDPLIHSSLLADVVSGAVEGAICLAALTAGMAMMTTGLGTFAGVALIAVVFGSGVAEDAGDLVGQGVDAVLDFFGWRGPPDAIITSGSHNVHIMDLPAARAAGTVDHDYLNTPIPEESFPDKAKAFAINTAVTILEVAQFTLHPLDNLAAGTNAIASSGWQGVKNFAGSVWDNLTQPVVAGASPFAKEAPLDTVECTKGHTVTGGNFLAEGSKKVLINGQPACRDGDRSTCEAKIKVKENTRVRIGGESIVVRDIRSGKNFWARLIGNAIGSLGPGIIRNLSAGLLKTIFSRQILKAFCCQLAADLAMGLTTLGLIQAGKVGSEARHTQHPVDIASGAKILAGGEDRDFTLEDRIPLIWQRIYNSRNLATGMLGTGWLLPFETRFFRLEDNTFIWRDMSGRDLGFGELNPGDVVDYLEDGITLYYTVTGTLMLQMANGEYHVYEPDPTNPGEWRLFRIYDRHENCQYYNWDEHGRLVRISSDNEALDVELAYETAHGRLASVHQVCAGERRLLVTYGYNEHGQLTDVTDADGIVTRRFGWDRASDMMGWHSYSTNLSVHYQWQPAADAPNWRVCSYQVLDDQDNVLERWRIDADEAKRCATVSCDAGFSTRHCWDFLYRITEFTDRNGGVWRYEWADYAELLKAATTPDGSRWEYGYDEHGNLTQVRDPLGNSTFTTWHPVFAFPLKEVLPDGGTWQYEYNARGDVVSLTDPKGGVTRFEWNEQGDLVKQTDALENTHRFWWNERGQLVRDEDCSGNQSHRLYDAAGRPLSAGDAEGNTDRWTLTAAGRLQTWRRADGRETHYEYDNAGLLCGQDDDGLRERKVTRNARGQVVSAADPAGHLTHLRYDRLGRLTTLVNPNRESWRFEYDATGRLTGQRDYAGRLTEYRHDALGQVTEVIRHPLPGSGEAPLVTAFEYDVLGRLTARETADHRTEYRHDTLSLEIRRATRAEWRTALLEEREPEWDAVLVFTRNAAGELVSEENHGGKFEYEYDVLGNLSSTRFPDGRELASLRYGTGHLLEMQLRHGGATHTLAAYGRDRLHRETSRSQGVLSQETHYDTAGRVTQRTVLDARRELVFERRYRWDRTDQIVQQIHTDATPATPGEKYSQYLWGYDAAGQVTKAVEPQKEERFFWDPAGNRTEEHRNPVWHNLLLRLDGLKLDYDGFGRLTRRQDKNGVVQHFAYDDEQRVKEIRFEGNSEFRKVEYRYDPLGRRTHKVLWRYGEKDPETIRFDWQGLQLAGEQSDREPDHYVQYVYTEGSYEPLARVDSVFDDCEIYWYHTELNGLPERVTDADGQTVWRGQFSTWGKTERELSVPQWQVPQNLRFQGQYLDRESGLHYNLFRYYDPVAGRYTQMDPIGLAGGINTYSYVGDPLVWVDPWGLMSCGSDAVLLRQNMVDATIEVPSFKNSAHHIVMSNSSDARMVALRQKMEDFDLDINGYYNGVFLPTSSKVKAASGTDLPAHSKIHTNTYKQNVYERLINIDNAEDFISELENISSMILKNKFEF
ncbi:RHS repeat-associated core domain-containing protein [Cronobacter dublinensis]|uniref:RHS repeat-associated core domain-containing protein n=1 Tax=Cronobacter dublinensis TaxID=413497 RepID=UPI000CFD17FF|nr:RHS repeat-associated core domain-containing protein [Cronobacter dublinensis]MDT3607985.1 RHS repeat-associated core domain-containing protein [Cronobacter dublinensis]